MRRKAVSFVLGLCVALALAPYGQADRVDDGRVASTCTFSPGSPACAGLFGAVAIDSSVLTTCAVLENGNVDCWGNAGRYPDYAEDYTGGDAVDVAVADELMCALLVDRTVTCWGRMSANGQLGFEAKDVVDFDVVDQGGFGETELCVVTAAGEVLCWRGSVEEVRGPARERLNNRPEARATALALVDPWYGCVIWDDGLLSCNGPYGAQQSPLPGIGLVRQVRVAQESTGGTPSYHASVCAQHVDGGWSCGSFLRNDPGEIHWWPVPNGENAVDVQTSYGYTCILAHGNGLCGNWPPGQRNDDALVPYPDHVGGDATAMIVKDTRACYVLISGDVTCPVPSNVFNLFGEAQDYRVIELVLA